VRLGDERLMKQVIVKIRRSIHSEPELVQVPLGREQRFCWRPRSIGLQSCVAWAFGLSSALAQTGAPPDATPQGGPFFYRDIAPSLSEAFDQPVVVVPLDPRWTPKTGH
jgi:hypothetical protein